MKFNPRKLKYNIWLYFILFALGIMCIVWFIQVVFTEQYFMKERSAEVVNAGNAITTKYNYMVDNPESDTAKNDFIKYVSNAEKIQNFVVLITTKDYNGEGALPDSCYPGDASIMSEYYGEYGDVIRSFQENALSDKASNYSYNGPTLSNENDIGQVYVYAKIISEINESGVVDENPLYVIVISSLSDINSLLSLIQKQLGIITIVVIVVAFFISLLISSSLANPLVNMSKTAKRLAKGDFSVEFSAGGYSEINELADTLNYTKEELKKTSVLQRELLANVTHDLKTPLTMVKAYAEMIKDISGDNKVKRDKHAQVIIDEADRLTMLVNDILNLSKVQSNVDALEIERINLSDLTNRVIDHFSSFTESNGYFIRAEIEDGLFVECDAKKIEQVIYNLIGNAINYTGENKTVEVFLTRNDKKVLLEIVDSGKGIDEEKINTIWEKYYRASETHKRPVKGTGLGLSIVKAILESHDLKYGVISKKNKGSNFFVEFDFCGGDEQ